MKCNCDYVKLTIAKYNILMRKSKEFSRRVLLRFVNQCYAFGILCAALAQLRGQICFEFNFLSERSEPEIWRYMIHNTYFFFEKEINIYFH
jgi:hypothetical protein